MAMTTFKQRVCYFYDSNIGSYYYGPGHPMKPHRLRMTHSLLLAYGMYKRLEVYQPHPATASEIEQFHTSDYVDFLRRVTPGQEREMAHVMQTFNLGNGTDWSVESDSRDTHVDECNRQWTKPVICINSTPMC